MRSRGVDIEVLQRETETHFTRPWSERRGIEYSDRHSTITLVRGSLDQLSNFLAARAVETQHDVLGTEIELSSLFGFAYQLTGHDWSIMIWDYTVIPNPAAVAAIPREAQLSQALRQPVITLTVSDSSTAYRLFERGEMTEYFSATEDEAAECSDSDGLPTQKYVFSPYLDVDPEAGSVTICFGSTRRPGPSEATNSLRSFPTQLMCELGAYDPDIGIQYLLGAYWPERGSRYTVQNPGFSATLPFSDREIHSVPDLVRVDYFKFQD